MKTILLSQGKFALVDDKDYYWLIQWKWHALKTKNTYYACRVEKTDTGKQRRVKMHIEIMGKKPGYVIDHKDGDGLNNQRNNLRHVTFRQNLQNRHAPKIHKYPGVGFHKPTQKWHARITINRSVKSLGYYNNEFDAFEAYRNTVKELTGEDVILPWEV